MPSPFSKKTLYVTRAGIFLNVYFDVWKGHIYTIQHEAVGEGGYGYLINTKNKKTIVLYNYEVRILE